MTSTIVILAVFGIVALLLEMVLPGGVLGVAGGLCLVASAILCFVEFGFWAGFAASVGIVVLGFSLAWGWMKFFHRLPGTRNLVLHGRIAGGDSRTPDTESPAGRTGTALTEIAPSGRAALEDQRFDVLAESTAIPKGAAVTFVRRTGPGWVVRIAEPDPDSLAATGS